MISAGDFRNGVTFEEDGNVLQVIEFQHVKPGKGAAFVRTKTRKTRFAVSFLTKAKYSVLSLLHSLLLKLPKQSRDLKATQLLTHLNLQKLKQAQKFVFLFSLTKAI